jgi:hypothetical protein
MKVENNWKYFNERTEGYLDSADFPICVCPRCLFYFDIIFNIKTKLSHKFVSIHTNLSYYLTCFCISSLT